MALLIAGIVAGGAAIGSLLTYAGTKFFSDAPTKEHVQTVIKNEIAAQVVADTHHENFQNNVLTILIGAVASAGILIVLRYAAIGIMAARRNQNNENNNRAAQILDP